MTTRIFCVLQEEVLALVMLLALALVLVMLLVLVLEEQKDASEFLVDAVDAIDASDKRDMLLLLFDVLLESDSMSGSLSCLISSCYSFLIQVLYRYCNSVQLTEVGFARMCIDERFAFRMSVGTDLNEVQECVPKLKRSRSKRRLIAGFLRNRDPIRTTAA